MDKDLKYRIVQPTKSLEDFVESFWCLQNQSDHDKEISILPDGRIDLIISKSSTTAFQTTLLGISTAPDHSILTSKTTLFAISFKLLSTTYILKNSVSDLLNTAQLLPDNFWGLSADDLHDFDHFCRKASLNIQSLIPTEIDPRKQKLFQYIYASNGEITVSELADQVSWSSRQINRYFNQQFGLSLKAYCNILRFRSSFTHIKDGKLFPQQNFSDQSHFIKEIKKLSGVSPKKLNKNQNDRFIQFSTLDSK